MHGAGAGDDHQRSSGVLLQQTRLQGEVGVSDWIVHKPRHVRILSCGWPHLPQ
jgi:hypothetical protein